jgi:hypothetical protein
MVRVRSQRTAGENGEGVEWARHESGILGRVVLGVGEVCLLFFGEGEGLMEHRLYLVSKGI